jgi:hypothetical protein
VDLIKRAGMWNSLSQVLLKIASPGVPDFYQGSEIWDFSLVDPDNRRPVDYGLRRRLLEDLRQMKDDGAPIVDRLLAHGLTSMMLFTEADNEPACNFYDGLGGERQVDDKGEFGGMYGWPDLRQLQANIAARSGPS